MPAISSADSRVLIGTSRPPASGTAKCATSISAQFGARYATRSPGCRPRDCRAWASRVTWADIAA